MLSHEHPREYEKGFVSKKTIAFNSTFYKPATKVAPSENTMPTCVGKDHTPRWAGLGFGD
jgi:hypothetical protein